MLGYWQLAADAPVTSVRHAYSSAGGDLMTDELSRWILRRSNSELVALAMSSRHRGGLGWKRVRPLVEPASFSSEKSPFEMTSSLWTHASR